MFDFIHRQCIDKRSVKFYLPLDLQIFYSPTSTVDFNVFECTYLIFKRKFISITFTKFIEIDRLL